MDGNFIEIAFDVIPTGYRTFSNNNYYYWGNIGVCQAGMVWYEFDVLVDTVGTMCTYM